MPNLDSLLSFPIPPSAPIADGTSSSRTPIPPVSAHILVTDTLDSPATFVLVHFLRAALSTQRTPSSTQHQSKGEARATESHNVIWLACDGSGLGHWRNVVRRSGIQFDAEIAKGSFRYLDASSLLLQGVREGDDGTRSNHHAASTPPKTLTRLYDRVNDELRHIQHQRQQEAAQVDPRDADGSAAWEAATLVVIDDLSALAWSLETVDSFRRTVDISLQVSKWIRALRALAAKSNACIVTLQHADATSVSKTSTATDAVDERTFRSLVKTADVWVEVKELVSGRARDCDGEITVHPLVRPSLAYGGGGVQQGPTFDDEMAARMPPLEAFAIETPCPSRARAMLYRIAPDGQTATSGGAGGLGANTGRIQVWARGTGRGFL